jgi:hypothetical protein
MKIDPLNGTDLLIKVVSERKKWNCEFSIFFRWQKDYIAKNRNMWRITLEVYNEKAPTSIQHIDLDSEQAAIKEHQEICGEFLAHNMNKFLKEKGYLN